MAKNKFGLDFDGFLQLAEQIDRMGGDKLKVAVENAMTESKDYANGQIASAMATSPYSFIKGKRNKNNHSYSQNKAQHSLSKVMSEPVSWEGNECIAKVGADLKEAPELLILALGTPHLEADKNLNNAIKVKGKYRKEASKIQQEEFFKVIQEAQND